MNELFLSLKYVGVKTPLEILKSATQYGGSGRKWIRNQENPKDKQVLKEFSGSLIDEGTILYEYLPEINRISERVQRWRRDPIDFSIEPEERDQFKELRRYLSLARENPSVMHEILRTEFGIDANSIGSLDRVPDIYKLATVTRFSAQIGGKKFSCSLNVEAAKTQALEFFGDLLDSFGYEKPSDSSELMGTVEWFLEECDLKFQIEIPKFISSDQNCLRQLIAIEEFSAKKEVLCKFEYRQGKVYVRVNQEHLFCDNSLRIQDSCGCLMLALGDTYLSQLGASDAIEEFIAELGINLNRRLNRLRNYV